MTALQKAAKSAIKEHGSVRKAANVLGINYAYLHRISTGHRKTVSADTAAKLGLASVQRWRYL